MLSCEYIQVGNDLWIDRLIQAGWGEPVGVGSFIVFVRLREFYNTFTVLAALVAARSAGVLTFEEVRSLLPTSSCSQPLT